MPNASELQRQHEDDLIARRTQLLGTLDKSLSKRFKENVLREVRKIENELGIVGLPYNGGM